MKQLTLLLVVLLTYSCQDDLYTDFCDDVVTLEVDNIQNYVDDILEDLPPLPVPGDNLGHEENLINFIDVLHAENPCITAYIDCYACIEVFPPQSALLLSVRTGSVVEERYLYIVTPSRDPMFFVGISLP